jgi:hypothetical protein
MKIKTMRYCNPHIGIAEIKRNYNTKYWGKFKANFMCCWQKSKMVSATLKATPREMEIYVLIL